MQKLYMIPRSCPQHTAPAKQSGHAPGPQQLPDWREELRRAITSPEELLQVLQLAKSHGKSRWLADIKQHEQLAAQRFSLKVPRGFVARMQIGDPYDPLLLQVLARVEETQAVDGFNADPVGDQAATCEPGLIQKYHGRALLITTGACAIHCRYCFRRHFPYSESHTGGNKLDHALTAIHADTSLKEVILSGGDPLMLDDEALALCLEKIGRIPHIERIRIHSRLPIVLPERITAALAQVLAARNQDVILVVHANHPNEIDSNVIHALTRLYQADIRLYNQAVLLKGVNDDSQVLATLCELLFRHHVQPYYLHQLDRVAGAAHFEVPEARAKTMVRELQAILPGYLVPKYTREIPGAPAKTLINI